jgi:NitT/TauT family transport system permease protein
MITGNALIRLIVVTGCVMALELACRAGLINRFTVIPPSEMVLSLIEVVQSPTILGHIATSALNILAAAVVTMVSGFVFGLLIHGVPRLRDVLEPVMTGYYAIPVFAFYPLSIVIFGAGNVAIIVMGVLLGLPSMILATWEGVDNIPPVLDKVAQSLHMSAASVAVLLKLPAAAPYLFTGVRLTIAYSFIGVIASEFILSGAGVGFAIAFAYNSFDTHGMYGLILFLMVFVTLLNVVLHTWDKRLEARRLR